MFRKSILTAVAIATIANGAVGTTPAALTVAAGATLAVTAITATPAAAAQCGQRVSVRGIAATGLIFNAKKRRAERRAKRAWRGFVAGENGASVFSTFNASNHPSRGLGTRFADLNNARNVVINCQGGGKMYCTVTATPCTG